MRFLRSWTLTAATTRWRSGSGADSCPRYFPTEQPTLCPTTLRHVSAPPTCPRFIRWTQDTFSAGGHKAELMPLLERATRELQSAAGGRYRGDVRYLRLWVQYVSICS